MLGRNTVNKIILMGYISAEPRWHKSDAQLFLCFPLITVERIKSGGEQQSHEEVHKIRIPGFLPGVESLTKGSTIYLQGRLQTKMFLDEHQIRHYRSEIVATNFDLIEVQVPVL
jgi:single-strand DNA-binding protein